MPIVRIEIYQGFPKDYRQAILDNVHSSLVKAFKIPEDDRNQLLYELDESHFERRGNKTRQFTIINIQLFKGRSFEAKKLLYQEIVQRLGQNPGIEGNDILIILNEQPLENWGVYGGKPANEVDLGFKVDI